MQQRTIERGTAEEDISTSELFDGIEEREDIPLLMNRLGLTGAGIEVGAQAGLYAQIILGGSRLEKLYLLDCWDLVDPNDILKNDGKFTMEEIKATEAKCRERFNFNPRALLCKGFSDEICTQFDDGYFDFIYLDAAHDYQSVIADLNNWYPKLKAGGVLAGHDYLHAAPIVGGPKFMVIEAVTMFRQKLPEHEFFVTSEHLPSWIIVKPEGEVNCRRTKKEDLGL